MLEKARYIVVEGPIGAGKTSLARKLAERLGGRTLMEQPELNPFLGRFYADMDRWAMATQLAFLFQRSELLKPLPQQLQAGERVVSDFVLDKELLFADLNLGEDEAALYRQVLMQLQPAAPRPDLVVYLQAQPDTLVERVRKRGMDAEKRITEDYLERVARRYAEFFHQYDAAPLFIVNAEELNPVDRDEDFELLWKRLMQMRSYREFFGYAQ
ncbi:deoxynucleoside kinase [Uliginosibacterium sp. H1]|uniref:deoxynucleoside kinase n=1 Tax=Uliginosibacterium sp. H1 TaxID=3114757 RepID=UPI002E172E77|nr:deoxynucleoside kinase [Uliginosibacterium sp. H1]